MPRVNPVTGRKGTVGTGASQGPVFYEGGDAQPPWALDEAESSGFLEWLSHRRVTGNPGSARSPLVDLVSHPSLVTPLGLADRCHPRPSAIARAVNWSFALLQSLERLDVCDLLGQGGTTLLGAPGPWRRVSVRPPSPHTARTPPTFPVPAFPSPLGTGALCCPLPLPPTPLVQALRGQRASSWCPRPLGGTCRPARSSGSRLPASPGLSSHPCALLRGQVALPGGLMRAPGAPVSLLR